MTWILIQNTVLPLSKINLHEIFITLTDLVTQEYSNKQHSNFAPDAIPELCK